MVPQGHFSLVNIEGTHQMLSWVNEFLAEAHQAPLFEIHLVGLARSTTQSNGLFTINPELLIQEVEKTDLIVLPAIHGALQENLARNAKLVPWIVNHYRAGAEIVSLCVASFFLAATGLLDGKPCSTHWHSANEFRRLFPEAHLMDDKIMTEADGIYTSGGAFSFTNLLIYLIEKYAGREVAVMAAKTFMIDIDRQRQSPFMIFVGQKTHEDEVVLQAQAYIEQNFQEKISVTALCQHFGVGRRTFERRFKQATANTIIEYAQRVKVESAKRQLEHGRKTINEVMYDVGYNDTKAFREIFKKITGMSPGDYRRKYNKDMVVG